MDEINSNKIKDKLIEYSKNIPKETIDEDAKGQIKDPNKYALEFVFGVILDQGIKYEGAWSAPNELKKRLGNLDVNLTRSDVDKPNSRPRKTYVSVDAPYAGAVMP